MSFLQLIKYTFFTENCEGVPHSNFNLVYHIYLLVPLCTMSLTNLVCSMQMFIDEVMELVELLPLKDALVGLPGVSGLSTEQRKRLTIAVELVANPSIIFMDEPTSGLDARAAAIVMRAIRNTVDTGRTVVCTIHQPSIDIFESFDEVKKTILNIISFSRMRKSKTTHGSLH